MKNAMKKIMSLVLVAMILVSALPVAASAAGFDVAIDVNNVFTFADSYESISYNEILAKANVDLESFDVTVTYHGNGEEGTKTLNEGETLTVVAPVFVNVATEPKAENNEPENNEPENNEPENNEPENNGRPGRPGGSVSGRPSGRPENNEPAPAAKYDVSVDVDGKNMAVVNVSSISYAEVLELGKVDTDEVNVTKVVYDGNGETETKTFAKGTTLELKDVTRIFVFTEAKTTKPENNDRPNGRPENNDRPGRPDNDDDDNNRPGNNRPGRDDDEGYSKFSNEVWLYIYTGTSIGEPNKRVLITDGIAADGKVTLSEVKSVVKYYYNAVDADTGITYDGIYPMQGGWVEDYIKDRKYNTVDGLYQAAAKQTVILRVMIGNATPATTTTTGSGNADATNPKTGDQIYMAITTMAISASVLALGFYFTKKRAY